MAPKNAQENKKERKQRSIDSTIEAEMKLDDARRIKVLSPGMLSSNVSFAISWQ